jgi:hypothetical protein
MPMGVRVVPPPVTPIAAAEEVVELSYWHPKPPLQAPGPFPLKEERADRQATGPPVAVGVEAVS